MSNVKLIFSFTAGLAIGAVSMYTHMTKKCEDKIASEIEKSEKFYKRKYGDSSEVAEKEERHTKKDTKETGKKIVRNPNTEYHSLAHGYGAEALENGETDEKPVEWSASSKPRVIDPVEYVEFDDRETCTIHYYAEDNIYTDSDDKRLRFEEVDMLIGLDKINHFGEYEPDSVYILNEKQNTIYELLLEEGHYEGSD